MYFKGDILITDPCYLMKEEGDDWEKCEYGDNMSILGINTCIVRDTIYGDWSCETRDTGTGKTLGAFCADAGLVCVVLLEEVLKYNPDFDCHLNNPRTTTWIKNFDGEVDFEVSEEEEVSVVGKGNVNFYTLQTGF